MVSHSESSIAIITPTSHWNSGYSINTIVCEMITFLIDHGHTVKVFCSLAAGAWKEIPGVTYIPCLPTGHYVEFDEETHQAHFLREKQEDFKAVLREHLDDVSIVIAHDLTFLKTLIGHNEILRELADLLPHLRWIHWVHSTPTTPYKTPDSPVHDLLFTPMNHSVYVTVSEHHREGLSRMTGAPLEKVYTIPNPRITPALMNLHPLTVEILNQCAFLDADISMVLPANIVRSDKQHEIVLFLMASLKTLGKRVSFILASQNEDFEEKDRFSRILILQWLARQLGITEKEFVCTYDFDGSLQKGCPERIVFELLQCSNVFVLPSRGEACSLALLEACAAKNLCVVNAGVASNQTILAEDGLYFEFDYVQEVLQNEFNDLPGLKGLLPYYEKYRSKYDSFAQTIIDTLDTSSTLRAFDRIRKFYRTEVIFQRYLAPLIEDLKTE